MENIITDAELSAGIIDFDEVGMPIFDQFKSKNEKKAFKDFLKHFAQEMTK